MNCIYINIRHIFFFFLEINILFFFNLLLKVDLIKACIIVTVFSMQYNTCSFTAGLCRLIQVEHWICSRDYPLYKTLKRKTFYCRLNEIFSARMILYLFHDLSFYEESWQKKWSALFVFSATNGHPPKIWIILCLGPKNTLKALSLLLRRNIQIKA